MPPPPEQVFEQPPFVPEGHVRLGVITQLPRVVNRHGGDATRVLASVGLSVAKFANPANTAPIEQVGELAERSVEMIGCQHLGLLVCEKSGVASTGFMGPEILGAETVGLALQRMIALVHLQDRGAVPIWSVEGDTVSLGYIVNRPGVSGTRHIHDGSLTVILNIMRDLCGPGWNPREALFARRPPADPGPYRALFRCKLQFNADQTAIRFPARTLALRPITWGMDWGRAAEGRDQIPGETTTGAVRRLLPRLLLGRECDLETAARRLGLHPRTLNRRLEEEGTGFRDLTNEARFVRAQQLMVNTDLTLGEIAACLGYSEASAFSRAFRRWAGVPPTVWQG